MARNGVTYLTQHGITPTHPNQTPDIRENCIFLPVQQAPPSKDSPAVFLQRGFRSVTFTTRELLRGKKKKKCWHLLSPPKISLRLLKIYQLLTADDTRAGRQITYVEKQHVHWIWFQVFTQSMTPSVLYITGQWIILILPLKRPISIPSQS